MIAVLELAAGAPPSSGVEILAWRTAHSRLLPVENELLFFATVALIPAVIALYRSLASTDLVKAALGCGVIAVVIPIFAMLDVVQGRLVYPVYGMRVATPEVAEFVVTFGPVPFFVCQVFSAAWFAAVGRVLYRGQG